MAVPKSVFVTPARQSSIELLSDSVIALSRDEFVPAIYPGQPFGVRWHYASLLANLQAGASISATVLSKNKLAELRKSSIPYAVGGVSEEIKDIYTKEASVYRIANDNSLILQSGITAIPASLDESSATYAVVPEDFSRGLEWDINSSSDEFRVPSFAWKEAYTIGALFTNISQWVTLSGTASLLESGSSSGPWATRGTVPVQLSAGRMTPLTFPERKQEWGWFAPGIWVVYGDLYRPFFYAVQFNLTDEFGNSYAFRGPGTRIAVSVSDRKFALAMGATAAMALALILYLVSWLITPAPAGAAQAVAAGLGGAALDPPRPSKRFRLKLPLPKRVNRSLGPQLGLLAAVLAEAGLYARLDRALYRIESRYLGAIQARDSGAARIQRDSYRDATRLMSLTAGRLSVAVDAAQPWLRSQKIFDEAKVRKALARWSRKGLKNDMSQARNAFDAKTTKLVEKMVQSPELVAAALDGMEANLIRLRSAILEAAAYSARDRLRFDPRARHRKG